MKIEITIDVDRDDADIFLKSLAFFSWNNPASISIDKLIIDDVETIPHEFWSGFACSKNISLNRVETFKSLIHEKD